jgi:hypothetical protein
LSIGRGCARRRVNGGGVSYRTVLKSGRHAAKAERRARERQIKSVSSAESM